jgi:hypothetical protein
MKAVFGVLKAVFGVSLTPAQASLVGSAIALLAVRGESGLGK